jgi:hypothetical protein
LFQYEDLVNKPETVMHEIVQAIDIEWNDILLKPTAMGRAWGGNSTSGLLFNGIFEGRSDAWRPQITDFEKYLVRECIGDLAAMFGYPVEEVNKRRAFLPNPQEGLAKYLMNRLELKLIRKQRGRVGAKNSA